MVPVKVKTLLLVCITVNINSCFINDDSKQKSDLYLMIGLPLQHTDSDLIASWERGREILPGAKIAIESINLSPNILSGHILHAIEVDIGRCGQQSHNFLLEFVNITFHHKVSIIGAVGIFCPIEVLIITSQSATTVIHKPEMRERLKSAVRATYYDYTILQSTTAIKIQALLEFVDVLNWRTIAVITDNTDVFFSTYVEQLYKASVENGSNTDMRVYSYTPSISVTDLPRIVIISVSRPLVIELLCNAYKLDLMWPKHIWILHTYHLEDFADIDANYLISCNIETAMENTLIVNEEVNVPPQFTGGKNYRTNQNLMSNSSNIENKPNIYSIILHDLVWSVALAVNDSPLGQSTSSPRMSPARQIRIIQIINFTEIPVATYFNGLVFRDPTFITNAPSDKLIKIVEGASFTYTVVFIIEIIGGFIL